MGGVKLAKKNWLRVLSFILAFNLSLFTFQLAAQQKLSLWYDKPATIWEETLPLGNGRLGMTPDGGISKEKIVLNDITLWSGSPQDANNYQASKSLPEIRKLILEGRNDEAQALVNRDFVCKGPGSGGGQWGKFQTLGTLEIDFNYTGPTGTVGVPKDYIRELSLDSATANCSYTLDGVKYTREYFSSFDGDVNAIRISADKVGMINCRISMSRPERFELGTDGQELQMSGQLDNGTDGKGMKYLARMKAQVRSGQISTEQNSIVVKDATELVIYLSAATDFRGLAFREKSAQLLQAALKKSYDIQKAKHIANFRKLFERVQLDLGTASAQSITTDQRLEAFHRDPSQDPALAALFFQYARFLSISSTRLGLLPPNLQGLWAKDINTPWNSDYHLDVNVQMNHWPLEVSNLSELNLPLADLVKGLVKPGARTAKAYYNAQGWIAHVVTNVWGFTEPGESASWGASNAGSGWLCNNLWEHYAFSLDRGYLKDIYPVLKGSAEFYYSAQIKDPKTGWMVTSPSVSPENTFYLPNGKTASISMGPTIDNQIIRELFTNVITASRLLNVDPGFRKQLEQRLQIIPPAAVISKDGRIQEWIEDYKETEVHHRHLSHLYGLYPASLITPTSTPELARAAGKTLEVRGDDGPSWSIAYKVLFWARLQDGNRAFKLVQELLKPPAKVEMNYGAGGGVYPNLLSAGPPFQIDGNFGAAAGIAEMLLQSHDGFIDLLPALPDAWKASGDIKGLKARGNFTVDMTWRAGRITHYRIASAVPRKVKVRVNGSMQEITSSKL